MECLSLIRVSRKSAKDHIRVSGLRLQTIYSIRSIYALIEASRSIHDGNLSDKEKAMVTQLLRMKLSLAFRDIAENKFYEAIEGWVRAKYNRFYFHNQSRFKMF